MLWALTGSTRLLLPKGLWSLLSWEQQRTLLVHELAHVRRRDHWVRVIEMLATALYWWHPVTWWARYELREAEEACCDAWVTSTLPMAQKSYATALLATVDFLAGVRRPLPLAASGVGQVRHLQRRLTMIMNGTTPRSLSRYGCLGVLGLSLALMPVLPTFAQAPPQDRPPDPPDRRARQDRPPDPDRRGRQDQPSERGESRRDPAPAGFTGRVAGFPADQSARDQIEKLEAMLQVKRAEIRKAEVAVKGAEQMLSTSSRAGGAVSEQERNAQRLQLEGAQADLEIKRAEARVVEIEIAQARRRGERFMGLVPAPAGATPAAPGTPPAAPSPPRAGFGGFARTPTPGAPGAGSGAPMGGGLGGTPQPGGPGAGAPGGQGPAFPPPGGSGAPGAGGRSGSGGFGGFGGGSGGAFGGGASRDVERRLDELEKKLNRLLEEMERMRPEQPRLRGRGEGAGREQPPAEGGRGPTRRGDGGGGRERDDEARPPNTPRPPQGYPPARPGGREEGDLPK
jgi:hypothetical protein